MKKIDLRNLNLNELENLVTDLGEQVFRAKQIFQWLYQKGVTETDEMKNLPEKLREKISEHSVINSLSIVRRQESQLDETIKYLLKLPDGETIETVLMSYFGKETRDRRTICVSSQVGCKMGCTFCATGLSGWKRNLNVGEIVSQVLAINRDLSSNSRDLITNVVFMGMGEPLLNYDNVIKSIQILNHPLGLKIGLRKISISTCGIVPGIYQLAKERLPIVLAISLHAPNDELRSQLMPINRKYPLKDLIDACKHYLQETNRRITFEYVLISGVNDRVNHAKQLASQLKGILAHINLIPFNAVTETGLKRTSWEQAKKFQLVLQAAGIETVIREEKGSDINAACGQLRRQEAGDAGELGS